MANWTQNVCGDLQKQVPTWSGDGDGMIAIQHCTPENSHLESRFDDDEVAERPIGFCGFEELELVSVFGSLEEAQIEMARYAVAIGYYMYED